MNTFADLMNLLLCFFILLFALSTVSEEKFERISVSIANSIGVLNGGNSAISKGQLISAGVSQLNYLDNYFTSMGRSEEGNNNTNDNNTNSESNSDQPSDTNNSDPNSPNTTGNTDVALDQARQTLQQEMEKTTSKMYDQISDLSEQYSLGDYVELSMDPQYQFVQLSMKGSVLFESGSAEIIEDSKPILIKIGDVLKKFDGYHIEITGHTDNVPINTSVYRDNNWLSSARALNAAEFLIKNCDIDPTKLKYSGRGEYEPISSNTTEEGRVKNRRIEIKIFNEYSGG